MQRTFCSSALLLPLLDALHDVASTERCRCAELLALLVRRRTAANLALPRQVLVLRQVQGQVQEQVQVQVQGQGHVLL